jgi:hypothetical protein
VTKLSDKAENALNETRMLVLGAQVLIGFDFQAVFQPGFDRLPATAQNLDVLGLSLMLVAVGLLIAPGAFHQIAEGGDDTPRLIEFTGRIAAVALLPFAIAIGIELYIVGQAVLGPSAALMLGVVGTAFALFFWYVLDWIWRARDVARGIARKEQSMSEPTSVESRIKQVLTEARVVLPGVQALLGFQLTAMLTDAFGQLPKSLQYLHLASLGLLASSMVFLMAPAAFHRIVERGEDTERLHRFSSTMILTAMVPLGLGLAADFYVVLQKVLDSPALSAGLAVTSLVFFFGLWFGVTHAIRGAHARKMEVIRAVR